MSPAQQLVLRWLEFSLATAVLLAVAKLLLIRLKQPADRIHLILLGFAMAALIPVLGVLTPIPRVELGWVGEVRVETGPPVALPEYQPVRANSPSDRPVEVSKDLAGSGEPVVPLVSVPAVASTEETQTVPQSFVGGLSLPIWELTAGLLILIHLLVAGFFLVEWWIASRVLSGIRKRAQMPQPFLLELWREISQGKSRSVRLLVSGEIAGPMAFGFWQPTILIPESMVAGPTQSLKFCLKHEWAHIENGDLRALGFVWGCQFLLWIQPLFWLLRRDLRICQDFLADHRAAGEGLDRVDYSQLLLDCTKHRLTRPIPGTIALFDRSSHLGHRIRMVLDSKVVLRMRTGWGFRLGTGAGFLVLAILFGSVQLQGAGQQTESTLGLAGTMPPESNARNRGPGGMAFQSIYGTVVDPKGQPISGATVALPLSEKNGKDFLPVKTDAMGKFALNFSKAAFDELRNPLKGTLWVSASGFQVAVESIQAWLDGSKESLEIRIPLTPGLRTSFTVLDPQGVPLPDAKVDILQYLFQNDWVTVPGKWMDAISSRSNEKGIVSYFGIQPERIVTLQVQSERYGSQTLLVSGLYDHAGGVIRLKETGRIQGRLVGDRPEWVRGVSLTLSTSGSPDAEGFSSSTRVVTDANGNFEVPHFLANCPIIPMIWKSDHMALPAIEETPWVVKPGSTLKMEIPLVNACRLRGVVRVKGKGTPVAGVEIGLKNGDFQIANGNQFVKQGPGALRHYDRVVTDANGRFEGKALPGPVVIQILGLSSAQWMTERNAMKNRVLIPDGTREFETLPIEVIELRVNNGKLVGANNQLLPGRELMMWDGKSLLRQAITGTEGQFSIRVPDGPEVAFSLKTGKGHNVPLRILQKDPLVLQYSGE